MLCYVVLCGVLMCSTVLRDATLTMRCLFVSQSLGKHLIVYFTSSPLPPTHLFQRFLLPPVVVFFLGMCAGVRMICVRGDRPSGGLYAPVFLNGDKSSTPALDDFSTHQSEATDRLSGRYRDRDRDNSVEDERDVILESDLHEIVLNPILEPISPPTSARAPVSASAPATTAAATLTAAPATATAPAPASASAPAPSAVYSPPAEVPQKTEQPEGK